jgi:hypothetical protein
MRIKRRELVKDSHAFDEGFAVYTEKSNYDSVKTRRNCELIQLKIEFQ